MSRKFNGFTDKQLEYMRDSKRKYNIFGGAAGSGKTYLGRAILIPMWIRNADRSGSIVIMGNTMGTVQRNIIEPMREMWGPENISKVSGMNTCRMFGRLVYVLGADKKSQVERIQGMNISYAYGDEVVTWSEEVFEMLKSRLRLYSSRFDGTCNPGGPDHWLKKFIDNDSGLSDEDKQVYYLGTVLDDGMLDLDPVKDAKIKRDMKMTLAGVFYDRLVLGKWVLGEGLVYPSFAERPEEFLVRLDDLPEFDTVNIGVDFGQSTSKHAFVATGITDDYELYVIKSRRVGVNLGPKHMDSLFIDFLSDVETIIGREIDYVYADSANTSQRIGLQATLNENRLDRIVRASYKPNIIDRINATVRLIGAEDGEPRLFYTEESETFKLALEGSVWSSGSSKLERLEDDSTDVDTLDAFEYSWSREMNRILKHGGGN